VPRCDIQGFSNRMCCAFQPCEVVQFVLSAEQYVCSAFSSSLIGGFGKYWGLVSISTDLVSVTVSGGWLLLAELPWIPVCPAQGSMLKAHCSPWNRHPL